MLRRLREYSERQVEPVLTGYGQTAIRYEIQLDGEGRPIGDGLVTLTGAEGRRQDRGRTFSAPALVRTVGIKAKLLVDNGEYALGIARPTGPAGKVADRHRAFIELVRECAATTDDPDMAAVLHFLDTDGPAQLSLPNDFDPAMIVTFSVEGRFPFQAVGVQRFWAERGEEAAGDTVAECLVCGRLRPPVKIMPEMIKGVPGGQTSGTALVSTNENAFTSYGLDAISSAPICFECAEHACKALNQLLRDEGSRIFIRPLVYVYWSREDGGFDIGTLVTQPDAESVGALLASARTGRRSALELDAGGFYCLGLSGSGGRVVVRDWIDTSIERAQANLARYFELQRLVDPYGQEPRYFGLTALSRATLREGAPMTDEPAPGIPRALLRAALTGGPLPDWLLAMTIKRVRAEQGARPAQVVLLKMTLASQRREGLENYMVGLDTDNREPAYLCGRLLAVLDAIQRAALGERNATIIDRFYGTASSAPISVFGRLVRGAQPHLAKLRRDRPGAYRALESDMQQIIDQLDGFPTTLNLRQQGLFVLGYYHQKAHDRAAIIERRAARDAATQTVSSSDQ